MNAAVSIVLEAYHERMRQEPRWAREKAQSQEAEPMLAVGPQTGRLLNIIAKSLKAPTILELGTSFGYSGIWLADAAKASGGRLITMESEAHKSAYAHEMSTRAGLADHVEFMVGDAVEMIPRLNVKLDLVLVDLWKDLYVPCLDAFYPKLNPGAIIVADNMIRPGGENIRLYAEAVRAKSRITSVLLPVGSGVEVSRYEPS